MFSTKSTTVSNKLRSTFSAFMVLYLLFTLVPPMVLATSSTRVGSTMEGYRRTSDYGVTKIDVAHPALKAAQIINRTSPLESGGAGSRLTPLFIAEDGSVVDSVAFDEGGEPCVPIVLIKGYFGSALVPLPGWQSEIDKVYDPLIDFLEEDLGYAEGSSLFVVDTEFPKDMDSIADDIHGEIERIKEQTGAGKVVIVSHSQGGIVSRA